MSETAHAELLSLSRQLLDAIDDGNWKEYAALCDPGITAFEPEAVGHLIEGMEFHNFYFKLEGSQKPRKSNISSPRVQLLGQGDAAVVTYVRVVQLIDNDNRVATVAYEETRIWQRSNQVWKHVHFHRSPAGNIQL